MLHLNLKLARARHAAHQAFHNHPGHAASFPVLDVSLKGMWVDRAPASLDTITIPYTDDELDQHPPGHGAADIERRGTQRRGCGKTGDRPDMTDLHDLARGKACAEQKAQRIGRDDGADLERSGTLRHQSERADNRERAGRGLQDGQRDDDGRDIAIAVSAGRCGHLRGHGVSSFGHLAGKGAASRTTPGRARVEVKVLRQTGNSVVFLIASMAKLALTSDRGAIAISFL